MTKSTITRERLEEIVSDPMINQGSEFAMMARMALAAMDSEPVRNPVLAYADSYRDMAKQGFESVPIWSVITDLERNIAPLYRHAQPAVDSDFIPKNLDKALGVVGVAIPESREEFNLQAERWIQRLIDRVIRYADEFQGQPAPVVPEEATSDSIEILASARRRDHTVFQWGEDQRNAAADSWNSCRAAMLHAGNPPAQSDCCPAQNCVAPAQGGNSLVIPDEMTPEEAHEIGYYYGDPVNVFARGANWMRQHIIDSTLAAAQHDTPALNSVQSVVTVPGKWIPVSERMPEVGVKVLCFPAEDEPIHAVFNGQLWLQDVSWSGSEEPIDNVIPVTVTHWMPLPAGPQEVR